MRCVFAVPSLAPEFGGPAYSVPSIARAVSELGARISYLTADGSGREVGKRLDFATWHDVDIVHVFGAWTPFNHKAVVTARRFNKPYVYSPLGMLEPWALRQKRLKKLAAWHIYQRRDLLGAGAVHATSDPESKNLNSLGVMNTYIAPHGVDVPSEGSGSQRGPRTALFLSRLHPKKGLLELIEAWARVRPEGWKLVVAGTDEHGFWQQAHKLIGSHGLQDQITYLGPAFAEERERIYRASDLFVLPTHSENFGLVIAEALSYGLPVLTTHGAPWADIQTTQSGWWIPMEPHALEQALGQATSTNRANLQAMGRRGRELIQSQFRWPTIGSVHLIKYQELLGIKSA